MSGGGAQGVGAGLRDRDDCGLAVENLQVGGRESWTHDGVPAKGALLRRGAAAHKGGAQGVVTREGGRPLDVEEPYLRASWHGTRSVALEQPNSREGAVMRDVGGAGG